MKDLALTAIEIWFVLWFALIIWELARLLYEESLAALRRLYHYLKGTHRDRYRISPTANRTRASGYSTYCRPRK